MKKLLLAVFIIVLSVHILRNPIQAGEVDILIDKLVEKGVLSQEDAKEILTEVKEEARKEREQVVQETKQALEKDGSIILAEIPEWIRNTTFKGDFRVRYEFKNRHSKPDRHRGRYRLRLGFVTEITDNVHVGFGLATGGSNPRSTNQTMTDSFDTPDIRLDYAYASYTPWPWMTLIGGKMKNPLWKPTNFLWDSDIRPEGVSVLFNHTVGSNLNLFLNTGFWIIDERSGDENDPVMFVAQPGYKLKIGDSAYLKNAVSFYQFDNVKGTTLDHSSESNTLRRFKGGLKHDYDAYNIIAELGIKNPFDIVPFFAVFGEYVNNRTVSGDDDGNLIGCRFGHKKVKRKNQWQVKVMYRRLERDAWLDIFPDADVYDGETNVKGYKATFGYGLLDNVILAFNYYYTRRISGRSLSEDKFQLDFNFKF